MQIEGEAAGEKKRSWRIEKRRENKEEGVAAVLRQLAEVGK